MHHFFLQLSLKSGCLAWQRRLIELRDGLDYFVLRCPADLSGSLQNGGPILETRDSRDTTRGESKLILRDNDRQRAAANIGIEPPRTRYRARRI